MLSKYIYGILGTGVLLSSFLAFYLNGVIEEKNILIGRVEVQLIASEASNKNLSDSLVSQNKSIDKFNTLLKNKNKVLANISEENNKLNEKVQEQLHLLNNIKHETCAGTINWMLERAIYEKENPSNTP